MRRTRRKASSVRIPNNSVSILEEKYLCYSVQRPMWRMLYSTVRGRRVHDNEGRLQYVERENGKWKRTRRDAFSTADSARAPRDADIARLVEGRKEGSAHFLFCLADVAFASRGRRVVDFFPRLPLPSSALLIQQHQQHPPTDAVMLADISNRAQPAPSSPAALKIASTSAANNNKRPLPVSSESDSLLPSTFRLKRDLGPLSSLPARRALADFLPLPLPERGHQLRLPRLPRRHPPLRTSRAPTSTPTTRLRPLPPSNPSPLPSTVFPPSLHSLLLLPPSPSHRPSLSATSSG